MREVSAHTLDSAPLYTTYIGLGSCSYSLVQLVATAITFTNCLISQSRELHKFQYSTRG